jgi:hypothetical protein
VNSEELEVSLRTEFENYINGVRAELKQELVDFQKMVESEVDKHRSQLDDAFKNFSARLEFDKGIDEALKESVMEHLRLARDDGAELAASAAAAAEMMSPLSGAVGGFDTIRDAIVEISSKTSQSAILKALTDNCSSLTARGAFFIIKNDNFVGWQVFGKDAGANDSTASDIHFPVSSDTLLAKSVDGLQTVQASAGSHKDDSKFLKSLKFGKPENMYAVPLIARGRGVAVLYADGGNEGSHVQIDAIEALVRVAGLTVELLASSPAARPNADVAAEQASVPAVREDEESGPGTLNATEGTSLTEEISPEPVDESEAQFTESVEPHATAEDEYEYAAELTDTVPVIVDEPLDDESYLMTDSAEEVIDAEVVSSFDEVHQVVEPEPATSTTDFAFEPVETEEEKFEDVPLVSEEPVAAINGSDHQAGEPAFEMNGVAQTNGRKRSRNVDLPIEVAEDEQDKHKKARSFARLLVSEIKLYNPDKVTDGKESKDLYDRLREAIDRSREMYDQRVESPVSNRFDYFHYELVNGLAEGDESRLGSSYPGAHS